MKYISKYLKGETHNIHFIGIGGIGMCGLAEYLLDKGYKVSGSDVSKSFITDRLERKGANVKLGHKAANIQKDTDLVVYTSAVKINNPEFKRAKVLGINTIKRSVLLGDIVNNKYLIAVSGTHGKTTTTSLLAQILIETGFDPTIFVGGNLDVLGGATFRTGKSGFAIVEADEYDRSFLTLHPDIIIINNIELDHVDIYKDEKSILNSFSKFTKNLKKNGSLVVNWDDYNVRKLMKSKTSKSIIKYGIKTTGLVTNLKHNNFKTTFNYRKKKISLNILGDHNVYNATSAMEAASFVCTDTRKIIKSVSNFKGVKRRLELKYNKGYKIFDDYAHHPSEIKTTLQALKDNDKGRVVVAFQPHTYTRTKQFYCEFAEALKIADMVYLLPIYAAREKALEGVNTRLIYDILKKQGCDVYVCKNKFDLFEYLSKSLHKNDRVIFQGAGDITLYCEEFIKMQQ